MLSPHSHIRGGIFKYTSQLVAILRDHGCGVVLHPWGRHDEIERSTHKIIGRFFDILAIQKKLTRSRFDVLLVNTSHDWFALARDVALLFAVRAHCPCIIIQFHGSHSERLLGKGNWLFKIATRQLLKSSNACFVLSTEEQSELQRFYPSRKFYVVKNPYLSTHNMSHSPVIPCPDLPPDKMILLYVGRLLPAKGIIDLVQSLPLIIERRDCHLLIVGDDKTGVVKECVDKLGVSNHVTFAGYLQGIDLLSAYRVAQIFILPTYWKEGFPAVLTEAMDAGLPIVTTRIRGAADHLEEDVNALFVPPRNPKLLADAIVRLLNDSELRARMANANREKVKEFAPEVVGKEFLQILNSIVEESPRI
jgi:glycosyltransferase involved in cell wall biosynthesis